MNWLSFESLVVQMCNCPTKQTCVSLTKLKWTPKISQHSYVSKCVRLRMVNSCGDCCMAIKLIMFTYELVAGLPRVLRASSWDRAPYSWNMVNLFLFGCHVTERTYASTDCTSRVGETIKRKGGVSQACLGKSTSFIPSQYFRMLLQFKVKWKY